jgi:hypothetical protein
MDAAPFLFHQLVTQTLRQTIIVVDSMGLSGRGKNNSATIRNPRATKRNGDSARSSASC